MSGKQSIRLTVSAEYSGLRLDAYLAKQHPDLSRAKWRKQSDAGGVLVNNQPRQACWIVTAGDLISADLSQFELLPREDLSSQTQEVYLDPYIICIDKPAGLPCHPLNDQDSTSAINALAFSHPECALPMGPLPREGGLIHRIDNETSGLLISARSSQFWQTFRTLFSSHAVKKEYLAIVAGKVTQPKTIDIPIAHHYNDETKMVVVENSKIRHRGEPRAAQTSYEPLESFGDWTLVKVVVSTAQRHQVRVHLAYAGHPLFSDALYLDRERRAWSRELLPQHALHAWKIVFTHPFTQQKIEIESKFPERFHRKFC